MNRLLLTFLMFCICFASCKKNGKTSAGPTPAIVQITPDSSIAPVNFNFNTTREVTVDVKLITNSNQPIAGVPVDVLANNTDNADPLLTAVTDANGQMHATLNLPAYADTLIIDAKYVGLMRNAKAVISGNSVNAIIGGAGGYSGSVVANNVVGGHPLSTFVLNSIRSMSNTTFLYMGAYDNSGVPKYLEVARDVTTPELLTYVNASLPETKNVALLHPSYLQSSAAADIFPFHQFALGDHSTIEDFCTVNNGVGSIMIGNDCRIGLGSVLIGPVTIGNQVILAQNIVCSGLNHSYQDVTIPIRLQKVTTAPIVIEDEAWIGANVVITAGVTIGKHSVVAAGAVVTKTIPPFSVAAGNPAKVIKQYNFNTAVWERVAK